jgi:hypothetical protein
MDEQPTTERRSRIGLALGILWVVVLTVALSGQCLSRPDHVTRDVLFSPDPASPPATDGKQEQAPSD